MKKIIVSFVALITLGNGPLPTAINDIVSIIRLSNGNYDVLCKDHTREIVNQQDILNNNLCPHISQKLDILIVVDNSGTMAEAQEILNNYAGEIIENLKNKNSEFQIAVTTTEAYKSYFDQETAWSKLRSHSGHSILTKGTPNLVSVFKKLVLQGTNGSGDERAFQSIKATLENSHNSNFLREDAQLQILILSDEDDFSHESPKYRGGQYNYDGLLSIKETMAFLDTLTNSDATNRSYSVTSIAVFDKECQDQLYGNPLYSPRIGLRYSELSEKTKGEKISLCDPTVPQIM
ncbi:MAG: hypothetical protein HOO06_06690 [Bdellovibrionaceae bacterium]|jgi:hypothetical protein|nr:hypothetical protein [Pseudobdellovibrionaceae bacterium]